jgi:uncharacterized protein (TIGR00297 family)
VDLVSRAGWGLLAAAAVSSAAFGLRWLSAGGALAAALLGTLVFGLGGLPWALVLLAFFVSASLLSVSFRRQKRQRGGERGVKGSRRDAAQVLANGGVAGLAVLSTLLVPRTDFAWLAFCGALAAATADTWATEIGLTSLVPPRSLAGWRPVEAGTSGGVTIRGLLGGVYGALFIALIAAVLAPGAAAPGLRPAVFGLSVMIAGLLGSWMDSLLGATLQAVYYCPSSQQETERTSDLAGTTATVLLRGWRWMGNDAVNALCTLSGALVALGLGGLLTSLF